MPIRLDRPRVEDGQELWRLARDSQVLDLNSPYSYVLWCRDFAATTVIAREVGDGGDGGTACGFITGYVRPEATDTFFVWQVAVDRPYRGRGLAARMLHDLAARMPALGCRYLEATVTPGNTASTRMFEAFARDRGAELERRDLFTAKHFPAGHEPEALFRIGPLTARRPAGTAVPAG